MLTLIWNWLRKIAWDEAYGEQFFKLALGVVFTVLNSGVVDLGRYGWWGSYLTLAAALFVRTGDKNDPRVTGLIEELAKLKGLTPPTKP